MKTIMKQKKINHEKHLVVGFDVGKKTIVSYSETDNDDYLFSMTEPFPNTSSGIEGTLREYELMAKAKGYDGLCVLCESSGGYQKRLLNMARERGNQVFYTSSEATHKASVMESNDSEKSDEKDPRAIHMLGKMDKVLVARQYEPQREMLKKLDEIYENESLKACELKNEISSLVDNLFPDLEIGRKALYGRSGGALVTEYALSPWRIVDCGYKKFISVMKGHGAKRISFLAKIWNNAKESVKQPMEIWERELLAERLLVLYEDWRMHESRKDKIREKMETLAAHLPEFRKFDSECLKSFSLIRVIAESGDPRDFSCWRQMMRYAGMNIVRRSSGKKVGRNKISKKGSALLRKVLYQYCFSKMIQEGQLFHDYFKKKREVDKKDGLVAMVAVMRKVLKMIYGLVRSSSSFDRNRVTGYNNVAA